MTYTQIETEVMNNLRLPVTNTVELAKVAGMINDIYRDLYVKHDWWFLVKFKAINTSPKVSAGTISVTQNSTAITFSTAPQQFSANVSVVGFVLIIPGQANDPDAVYRLESHVSGA